LVSPFGLFALFALFALGTCKPSGPPSVEKTRTLAPAVAVVAQRNEAPFAVVFGAPSGETSHAVEVSLLFNRPMRPLEVAGEDSAPPAHISVARGQAPAGTWRWLGTSALMFAPKDRLPEATEYEVTVPAGTRSLAGDVLAGDYTLRFSTPRPRLERLEPGDGDDQLLPTQTFEARFNQPVDPQEVERAATLWLTGWANARTVALHASRPDATNPKLVRLTPSAPLPLGTNVELKFDDGLKGLEGPLSTAAPKTFKMATYAPLRVLKVLCGDLDSPTRCEPNTTLEIQLLNHVPFGELKSHLRLEPAAKLSWDSDDADAAFESEFSASVHFRPGTHYRLVVTAGLHDRYGQTLAQDFTASIDVKDVAPDESIGVHGTFVEATPARPLVVPVRSVNMDAYGLAVGTLDEKELTRLQLNSWTGQPGERLAYAKALPGAQFETVIPKAARNEAFLKTVDLGPLLASTGGRGAAFLATASGIQTLDVTDLGISGQMSRFGSRVWVTRLSTGAPVEAAAVAITDKTRTVFETKTDARGIAVIPPDRYSPVEQHDDEAGADGSHLLVARLDGDWTWRRVDDVYWHWWGGPLDLTGGPDVIGKLITDRGVYRPGETIEVQGIFRTAQPHGTATPAGREVEVTLHDEQNEDLFTGKAKLDEFGEVALHVLIPATARLGQVTLEAKLGGEHARGGASASALVAAYQPSEFQVTTRAAAEAWVHGDEARFDVHGEYLFGAPMSKAGVHWTLTRERFFFSPPWGDGYSLDDSELQSGFPDSSPQASDVASSDGDLDAHGDATIRTPLALAGQRGTEQVVFEATVTDLTRHSVAARKTAVVHPASLYVGLRRPDDWFVPQGSPVPVAITAFDPTGQRRAGVRVHADLVRRTWTGALEASGDAGRHWHTKAVDTTVGSCDVATDGSGNAGCSLSPSGPGYHLVHARANDDKGRTATSSLGLYVTSEGGDVGWPLHDTNELELVTNKKTYRPGDTARVLVKSPFREAEALVTVERAGIYSERYVHLAGATPVIEVPVTEDLRPNAFVSVRLVRGRTSPAVAEGVDVGAPAFKIGSAAIVVDPESRRLKVAIAPAQTDLRPGATVDADVSVSDASGSGVASELTLWAVDEGVLMLTGYATPDPIPAFTAPRPLAVFSIESRADLATILTPHEHANALGLDKGAEGGGGGMIRSDFRSTAWFQSGVRTSGSGRAHVSFRLPDNLTTFRLMGVAVARDDRFGSGDARITTSKPLMLRPALPRFLRAGDSIEAGVVVTSKGLSDAIKVTASVDGANLTGDGARTVAIKPGESTEVRWPISAPGTGSARLTFRARGASASDGLEVTRTISPAAAIETTALEGETQHTAGEKLGPLDVIRGDVGGLDVRVASTALVGIAGGMDQILEYPYGCTEQLTSALVPLVAARDLAASLDIPLPRDSEALADAGIAKILANQRDDGGFGWWSDSRRSDPWMTAYALWGLDAAAKGGRTVPPEALQRGIAWLRSSLSGVGVQSGVGLSTYAFAVDVLASLGAADPGYANQLFERRDQLPVFARALLTHAFATSKMDPGERDELLRDLESHLHLSPTSASVVENLGDEYAPLLDSEARTTAMVLRAKLAAQPEDALVPRLVRGLLSQRDRGRWRSTQEAAWALRVLAEYRKAAEIPSARFDARVWLGNQVALDAALNARAVQQSAFVPAAQLLAQPNAGLTFEVRGTGDLFYEAELHYARKEMPAEAIDRGFFVRKLLRTVTTDALRSSLASLPEASQSQARAGDLVLIDILAVTPTPHEQVVIDDPLPAGLEPVDTSLATTARSLDTEARAEREPADDDDIASGSAWTWVPYHREMRDDRVLTFVEHMPAGMYRYSYVARATTVGKFLVPPTKAECMYDPGVFGRTQGSTFEVVP
jgi:uncharacterized protein YfaS (alpha-2-macroglobulin family)